MEHIYSHHKVMGVKGKGKLTVENVAHLSSHLGTAVQHRGGQSTASQTSPQLAIATR